MLADFSFFNQIIASFILLKIGFLLVNGLYIIFAFVIYNQIGSMGKIITEIHASAVIKILSIINITLAASLFLTALVIL